MNALTQAEWEAKGRALFGEDKALWAFKCPMCGNAMSVARAKVEFPELKGRDWRPEQECAGRYTPRVTRSDGTRCDWCSYGLFRGPLLVKAEQSGNEIPIFEFAEPARSTSAPAQKDHP